MKGYENLSSNPAGGSVRPLDDIDFRRISAETATRKEAISKAVEAVTMLLTRIMTVDACIDVMRRKAPFASLDRAMGNMSRICAELTQECLQVYEFCVADNVLAIQNEDKDEDPLRNWPDVAAEPPAAYGREDGNSNKA